MSLVWDCKNVVGFEKLSQDKTTTLVFATMEVGMNAITEKNYLEFWRRMKILRQIKNMYLEMTLDDVYMHIGLGTNADNERPGQFLKKVMADFDDNLKHYIRHDIRNSVLIPRIAEVPFDNK